MAWQHWVRVEYQREPDWIWPHTVSHSGILKEISDASHSLYRSKGFQKDNALLRWMMTFLRRYGWIYFPLSLFLFWVFRLSFVQFLLTRTDLVSQDSRLWHSLLISIQFISFLFIFSGLWHLGGNLLSHRVQTLSFPLSAGPSAQPNINLIRIRNGSAFSNVVTKFLPTNILPFVQMSPYIYFSPAGNPIRRLLTKG